MEERESRGRALGWAAWRRLATRAGADPKDHEARASVGESDVIATVMAAYVALEGGGFEGLEEWNDMEEAMDG